MNGKSIRCVVQPRVKMSAGRELLQRTIETLCPDNSHTFPVSYYAMQVLELAQKNPGYLQTVQSVTN